MSPFSEPVADSRTIAIHELGGLAKPFRISKQGLDRFQPAQDVADVPLAQGLMERGRLLFLAKEPEPEVQGRWMAARRMDAQRFHQGTNPAVAVVVAERNLDRRRREDRAALAIDEFVLVRPELAVEDFALLAKKTEELLIDWHLVPLVCLVAPFHPLGHPIGDDGQLDYLEVPQNSRFVPGGKLL